MYLTKENALRRVGEQYAKIVPCSDCGHITTVFAHEDEKGWSVLCFDCHDKRHRREGKE